MTNPKAPPPAAASDPLREGEPAVRLEPSEARLRMVLARRIVTLVTLAWAVFALLHAFSHRPWVTAVHAGAFAAGLISLLWVRQRPLAALYGLGVCSLIALTLVAAMTGGAPAPAMTFLALIPILAALIEVPLQRRLWLVMSLAGMGSVAFLHGLLPDESPVLSPLEYYLGPLGLGILAFLLGAVWRRSSAEQLELLENRRARITRQAEALLVQGSELATAREVAERASAAKSRFVAMTAHELRGPLNGVLGMAHVLRDTRLSSHQSDLVAALSSSADSLAKVLQDLLDLSKIEAGRVDVSRDAFEPRELVADVIDTFAGQAADKHLALGGVVAPDVPTVVIDDEGRLRQVLGNLVGNALKFTSRGEVRIELTSEGDRLIYRVSDTGHGIEAENVERVFAPFEQVSDALLDRRAGTGLGLWISRSFVEALGGTLGVESKRGVGTRFSVELPMVGARAGSLEPLRLGAPAHFVFQATSGLERDGLRSLTAHLGVRSTLIGESSELPDAMTSETRLVILDGDTISPGTLEALAKSVTRSVVLALSASVAALPRVEQMAQALGRPVRLSIKPFRASRILALLEEDTSDQTPAPVTPPTMQGTLMVVDDDEINRKVARFAATQFGYRVLEAPSGEAALAMLASEPVDVLLLDLHMEGMDGVQTAAAIVASHPASHRPSLLGYTGSVNEADRARCLGAGMEDVLAKPLDRATLGAALARAKRQRARRRGTSPSISAESLPVLHAQVLTKFVASMGGPQPGKEMIQEFLADLPARLGRFESALKAQDRKALRREGHTLAAAGAMFGAGRLTLSCRRVESSADGDPWSVLEERTADVAARGKDFQQALQAAFDGMD